MIRIYILLGLLGLFISYLFFQGKNKPTAETLKKYLHKFLWGGGLLLLAWFVLTGKIAALFAMLGVAVAFILRFIPALLAYLPQLERLLHLFHSVKYGPEQASSQQQSTGRKTPGKLSKAEALDILGLQPGASKADIIDAHRKLISRMHPDKGGSDYLAAQINLAKKALLES